MVTIVRQEGFSRLYRGISSPIVAEAPKRAAKFTYGSIFLFFSFVELFFLRFNERYKALFGAEHYVLAGTLAGASETVEIWLFSSSILSPLTQSKSLCS